MFYQALGDNFYLFVSFGESVIILIIDLEDQRLLWLYKLPLIEELRRRRCRRTFSPNLHLAF